MSNGPASFCSPAKVAPVVRVAQEDGGQARRRVVAAEVVPEHRHRAVGGDLDGAVERAGCRAVSTTFGVLQLRPPSLDLDITTSRYVPSPKRASAQTT